MAVIEANMARPLEGWEAPERPRGVAVVVAGVTETEMPLWSMA